MSTYPFTVHLDRKVCITGGVYDEGDDETTFTLPFYDATQTAMVLSSDFGSAAGTVLTIEPVDGDPVTAVVSGDYSAGLVTVGRPFLSMLELTRPFVRDFRNQAVIDGEITVREIVLQHADSCRYTIRASYPLRDDRSKTFSEATPEKIGKTRFFVAGLADKMRVFIENNTAHPCTLCAIDWTVNFSTRRAN